MIPIANDWELRLRELRELDVAVVEDAAVQFELRDQTGAPVIEATAMEHDAGGTYSAMIPADAPLQAGVTYRLIVTAQLPGSDVPNLRIEADAAAIRRTASA